MRPTLPTRLPLSGSNPRRFPFERRLRLWLTALTVPTLALATLLVYDLTHSRLLAALALALVALVALIAAAALFDGITRPLQTLSNVVNALREDDFSFRARGARRGDSLGDLALEINTLAGTLQHQRASALDALTLVERVLTSMPSPVLAFDPQSRLRLLNPAAATAFHLSEHEALGHTAPQLHLHPLLDLPDQGLYTPEPVILSESQSAESKDPRFAPARALELSPPNPVTVSASAAESKTRPEPVEGDPRFARPQPQTPIRWSVRRSTFRLHGVPHTLFVLTDVSSALREEERLAFQRLIRVLGHEINNSLTPIKSIAGSLRTRFNTPAQTEPIFRPNNFQTLPPQPEAQIAAAAGPTLPTPTHPDLDRGLAIIEDRADSLNRFLQAYQRLSRLPAPNLRPTPLTPLAYRVAVLETRLPIQILPSPDLILLADPDQLQQLLINLLRNAVDAAQTQPLGPQVTLGWTTTPTTTTLTILDNGPGLTNSANLFVPFYTTKPGGSGIGLVLAQQIVSAHRGTLTLTNRPNHPGCQAEIRLPLVG